MLYDIFLWLLRLTFYLQVLVVIGGQAPKAIRSVESYDFKEEKWNQVSDMSGRRCRCGMSASIRMTFYWTLTQH